jgi:hypothetical protein
MRRDVLAGVLFLKQVLTHCPCRRARSVGHAVSFEEMLVMRTICKNKEAGVKCRMVEYYVTISIRGQCGCQQKQKVFWNGPW